MIHRGKLVRFDKEIIVLTNVYETANREIDWVETKDEKEGQAHVRGFIRWRKVLHPRVIIRVQMVLRIWPWTMIGKPGKESPVGEPTTSRF
jgi:small nuclear ribonucleoprotein (snRNP)-like protein